MGEYTRKFGKKKPPHGKQPNGEGLGFTIQLADLPGQENADDPVKAYRVIDRFDGEVMLSGVEVESKVNETARRQLWLITRAGGLQDGDTMLVETLDAHPNVPNQEPHEGETEDDTDRRLSLENMCAEIGQSLATAMPPDVGFTLMMFNYGEGGNLAYMSTAQREDMMKLLEEFLEKQKAES